MVETGAGGRAGVDWSKIPADIIPELDETYNLGTANKRWLYLFAVIAILTSLTIGGVVSISTIDTWLYINASTQINGSLQVDGNAVIDGNLTVLGTYINATVIEQYLNGSFLPSLNNTFDIGSESLNWENGYFSNEIYIGGRSVYQWLYNMSDGSYNLTYANWNKTYADTLYSGIEWDYNQTTATYNLYNDIWSSTYNLTYASKNTSQWIVSGNNIYNRNSGNVGIGDTTPETKLRVVGNASFLDFSARTDGVVIQRYTHVNYRYLLRLEGDSDGDAGGPFDIVFTTAGNVGIGTTAPDHELVVNGTLHLSTATVVDGFSSPNRLLLQREGTAGPTGMIEFQGGNGAAGVRWAIATNAEAGNVFNIGYAPGGADTTLNSRFLIDTAGKIGIGTTTPTHKLNVVGNVNITGNITAENVYLPAHVFSHTNETIAVTSGGVWNNVTFDELDDSIKKRITHTFSDATNTTFTIQDAGIYRITYIMSFQDSAASPDGHIVARIVKNGVEIHGSLLEIDTTKQYADTLISHTNVFVNLVADDYINFQFTADDTSISLTSHSTYGDHRDTAVITIRRIS